MQTRPAPSWRRLLVFAGALLLSLLGGCNSSGRYPVRGTVVYEDGQPAKELAGGTVIFNSDELKTSASAEIDAQGAFRVSAVRPGDGLLPGAYQVTIAPPAPPGPREDRAKAPPIIDPGYVEPSSVTVERKTNQLTLKVRRAPGR
jgi:hypothetical protein